MTRPGRRWSGLSANGCTAGPQGRRALVAGLALLGLRWVPVPYGDMDARPGLYAWVTGRGSESHELLDRAVTYVGVGRGEDGGVRGRLQDEHSWNHEEATHMHGRSAYRLKAAPVGGPVTHEVADLTWLEAVKIDPRGAERLRTWLIGPVPDPVHQAERLCIRMAGHLGDTAPPVNCQHTGAWSSDLPEDWGGWAAAQRLRQLHSSPAGLGTA